MTNSSICPCVTGSLLSIKFSHKNLFYSSKKLEKNPEKIFRFFFEKLSLGKSVEFFVGSKRFNSVKEMKEIRGKGRERKERKEGSRR